MTRIETCKAQLKLCPFKSTQTYFAAIASRTTVESSSGLSIGGRQVKLVHTTATDFFSFSAGRLGIVSASAGGRLVATASLSVRCTTDKLTANGAEAALSRASALSSSPTT